MNQEEDKNQTQILASEGIENDSESAIGLNTQNSMRLFNRMSEEIKAQLEVIDRPQNIRDTANERVISNDRIPDENQIDLSRVSQRESNNELNLFGRFDFNRILRDPSPKYRKRYKNILLNINKTIEYQVIIFIFLLFCCLQCSITQIWRFQYPLLFLIGYYLNDIRRNIINYKRTQNNEDPYLQTIEISSTNQGIEIEMPILIKLRKRILIRTCIEDVVLILTCVFLIIYSLQALPLPSYACVTPLVFAIIHKFSWRSWPRSQCEATVHILSIWNSINRILILGFLLIKIEGLIKCSIATALWSYWVSLVILVILSILSLILVGNSLF